MTTTPRTKGQWVGSHEEHAREVLAPIVDSWHEADRIIRVLSKVGLLVSSAYYVPSVGELFDSADEMHYTSRYRWVMCSETWTDLWRAHAGQRARLAWPVGDKPAEDVFIVDAVGNQLLGIPVRIDPAARRPMWEVVE